MTALRKLRRRHTGLNVPQAALPRILRSLNDLQAIHTPRAVDYGYPRALIPGAILSAQSRAAADELHAHGHERHFQAQHSYFARPIFADDDYALDILLEDDEDATIVTVTGLQNCRPAFRSSISYATPGNAEPGPPRTALRFPYRLPASDTSFAMLGIPNDLASLVLAHSVPPILAQQHARTRCPETNYLIRTHSITAKQRYQPAGPVPAIVIGITDAQKLTLHAFSDAQDTPLYEIHYQLQACHPLSRQRARPAAAPLRQRGAAS